MASTLIRRTFRLSLTSPLFRRRQPLAVCSSFSTSSCRCPNCCPVRLNRTTRSALISVPSVRFFSSKVGADENLKKVLEAEIQQAKDDAEEHEQEALPSGFPFVIEDNPGDQTITLERVYSGEKIRATVYLNLDPDESLEDEDDNDQSGDDEEKGSIQSNISMVVTIDKGEDSFLEFCCILGPEEIQIDSMTTKKHDASDSQEQYEGPPFSDLDENLQSEFYKYLEVRGIKSSLFDFLQDYMVKKDEREYLTWLKNMKKFVEV